MHRVSILVITTAAALALAACSKPAPGPYDNAFNTVQADVKAEHNAENTPEAKAAANMAMGAPSNAATNTTP